VRFYEMRLESNEESLVLKALYSNGINVVDTNSPGISRWWGNKDFK